MCPDRETYDKMMNEREVYLWEEEGQEGHIVLLFAMMNHTHYRRRKCDYMRRQFIFFIPRCFDTFYTPFSLCNPMHINRSGSLMRFVHLAFIYLFIFFSVLKSCEKFKQYRSNLSKRKYFINWRTRVKILTNHFSKFTFYQSISRVRAYHFGIKNGREEAVTS